MKLKLAVVVAAPAGLVLSLLGGLAASLAPAGCGGSNGRGGSGGSGAGGASGGVGGSGATGGSDAGLACGVYPCGGDVVGTWTGSSACIDRAILSAEFLTGVKGSCPTASLGDYTLMPTGTLTLNADMSYTGNIVTNAVVDVNIPAACVGNLTCDQVAAPMQVKVGQNGVISVTCAGSGSCVCTTTQLIPIITATGTWATSGTNLNFSGDPGGSGPYCVQGSSLHLVGYDLATNTMIDNEIVLTKQ